MAVLLIIKPLTLVVCAIGVRVRAHALGLIIDPLSLIDVTIRVHQLALTVCLIVTPLAFITTAIGPELRAHAITHTVQPLTSVSSTIAQRKRAFVDTAKFINLLASRVREAFGVTLVAHDATTSVVVVLIAT